MTKLICSGCSRTVDVDNVNGNEVCKECGKPMNKITGETSAQEVVEASEKPVEAKEEKKEESKITLPTGDNLCGELPDFSSN